MRQRLNATSLSANVAPAMIIVGGDALALGTARELALLQGYRVVVLWPSEPEAAGAVEAAGAAFVAGRPDGADGLDAAGVTDAVSILALSGDDQLNLRAALRARDANPQIRIVLRQFNRTLAAKIEQNLPDCSVVSLAWHSAATYAAAALDPSCFRGLQFPERDGPLTGFSVRIVDREATVGEAEAAFGARIIALDGNVAIRGDDAIPVGSRLVIYGALDRLQQSTPRRAAAGSRRSPSALVAAWLRRMRVRLGRRDPYIVPVAAAALTLFLIGVGHFHASFGSDWLTAAYFVLTTMTTTGFGDLTPNHDDPGDVITAMLLMFFGTVFTGVFIAFFASRLTRAQWVRMQGLRPIRRRDHIVVCGCGSIGTGVVDLLLGFDKPLVVVEQTPDAALVERARDRGFDLLTGDASRDDTLDLCNLDAAHSLVALTNVDTLNLEIALGGRARNPSMPIVLRIAEANFAASIARHFQFETTFSVAALAGPVFAGLSRLPGGRGRIMFHGDEYAIAELVMAPEISDDLLRLAIPLATVAGGEFVLVRDFAALPEGAQVLVLVPLALFEEGQESIVAVADRIIGVCPPPH